MTTTLPFRARRKVGARETGAKSVFFVIHRDKGAADDIGAVGRDKLLWLEASGAVYAGTERADAYATDESARGRRRTWLWDDWYRVPVPAGATVDDVGRAARGKGVWDGPHWSIGRVLTGTAGGGAALSGARKAAPHRAAVRQLERAAFVDSLLVGLFGSVSNARAVLAAAPDAYPESGWEGFIGGGARQTELTEALWRRLCGAYPDFPRLWHVAGALGDKVRAAVEGWVCDMAHPVRYPAPARPVGARGSDGSVPRENAADTEAYVHNPAVWRGSDTADFVI